MIYRLEHSIPKTKDEKTIDGLSRSDYLSGDVRNILFIRANSEKDARYFAYLNGYTKQHYCKIWLSEDTKCELFDTEGSTKILE